MLLLRLSKNEELLMVLTDSPCNGAGDMLNVNSVFSSIEDEFQVAINVMPPFCSCPVGVKISMDGRYSSTNMYKNNITLFTRFFISLLIKFILVH